MTNIFDAYATYYDLFYGRKDYAAESYYVHELVQRYKPGSKKILELGCGTGGHARELSKFGYHLTGIDSSAAMIHRATSHESVELSAERVHFERADLRTFRSKVRFDVVIALFHVMSYQTSNEDLAAAIRTVSTHLVPGGIFIFDCWYGPGVLHDPPVPRIRYLKNDTVEITRIASPISFPNENRVDVNYTIFAEQDREVTKIVETHPMRYLFAPEVDFYLAAGGLTRIALEKWIDGSSPDFETWNACFVARL